MARGKTIQLYLMDSVSKGRIKCTLANWTGIAYKVLLRSLKIKRVLSELQIS